MTATDTVKLLENLTGDRNLEFLHDFPLGVHCLSVVRRPDNGLYGLMHGGDGSYQALAAAPDAAGEFDGSPFATGQLGDLEAGRIVIREFMSVDDASAFRQGLGLPEGAPIDRKALTEGMLNLPAGRATGLDDVRVSDAYFDRETLVMEVTAEVSDPGALARAARAAYTECWSDRDWRPDGPADALRELALASNANPSPDEMGFAFVHPVESRLDAPLFRAARDRVDAEPVLRIHGDESYAEWLQRTGMDRTFIGDGERVPGSQELYAEAVCLMAGPEVNGSPEP